MPQHLLFEKTRFESWCDFHEANPDVFDMFRCFANTAITLGKKVGARLIGERIRWQCKFEIEREDGEPKFNNNHWPYYARLLAGLNQNFENFFDFRDKRFDATIQEIVKAHQDILSKNDTKTKEKDNSRQSA